MSSTAIGYTRVSTHEQASEGVSLAAQAEAIEQYCKLHELDLLEIVTDEGVSGSIPISERPGGSRLVGITRRRYDAPDAVVAVRLDRLFRSAVDSLTQIEHWRKIDVALHLIQMGGASIDSSSPMGAFFLHIMAGVAQLERSLTRERILEAMRHKRASGQRISKDPPYGYRHEDGRVVEDAEEQRIITLIRDLREREGLSQRKIVEELRRLGVPARGERWHRSGVRNVLARLGD